MTNESPANRSRRRFLEATGGAATVAALSGYLDPVSDAAAETRSRRPSDRVERLVDEMTLEEKVGQMAQADAGEAIDDPVGFFDEYHVGSLLYSPTFDPRELAETANELQRAAVEGTRLGIPFVYGLDAVHGNNNLRGATIFPHNHGLGATWNADLAEEMAALTGRALRTTGVHWNFSPVADIQRDPRWGRFYEGFSEDVLLSSEMVAAKVRGYEREENGSKRVGSTVKHFAGYSEPRNGNDRTAARIPMRTLKGIVLPPYHAGLRAGAETVMVNSGSLNGIPAHASEYLLTELLRERWGFDGMVVSDWHDFHRMISVHEYVPDLKAATRVGINAGVDMYMVPAAGIEGDDVEGFTNRLVELVEEGAVSMSRIDDAVTNVLTFKENVGLFDDPYADPESAEEVVVGTGRDLARRTATQSITLLRNDGTLPLDPCVDSLLVTGPSADSVENQMGGWTLGWQGVGDVEPPATTVLDGISEAVSAGTTVHHEPTGLHEFDDEEAVRERAESAEAVVAVLGEGPYAEEQGDTDTLALPEAQQRLVETLAGTGTPTVGVILAGRPRGTSVFDDLSAALMGYLPGTEGGTAIADTLFGNDNPSGRLPFTWPTGTGQLLNVHNSPPPKAFNSEEDTEPPHSNGTPLFPFGHGLSYTEFEYDDLRVDPGRISDVAENDTLRASVRVANVGDVAGDVVVPAYGGRDHGPIQYPRSSVVGYDRVSLDAGESTRVNFEISTLPLSVVPGDVPGRGDLQVLTGEYWVAVDDLRATFTVE